MGAQSSTKKRGYRSFIPYGESFFIKADKTWASSGKNLASEYDLQTTVSQGHKGPPYKEGGDFDTIRSFMIRQKTPSSYIGDDRPFPWGSKYEGNSVLSCAEFPVSILPAAPTAIADDSLPYGAVGWNKFKPGRPGVQLGQDILELGEIPKTILDLKSKVKSLRDLAHKHLAWEFGAAPLISDLRYIYHLQKNLQKRLEQLARDNGRPVRRRGLITTKSTVGASTSSIPGVSLIPGIGWYDNRQGSILRVVSSDSGLQTKAEYTFAARFRYWIPDIGEDRWTRKAEAALLGLNPSLSLLYQVTPWSWLVDWFSNVGDVIDNLSYNAAENLVADYAYVMGAYTNYRTLKVTNVYSKGLNLSAKLDIGQTRKVRHAASPFGFGLTINTLSGRQMAILTSLGLVKSKF